MQRKISLLLFLPLSIIVSLLSLLAPLPAFADQVYFTSSPSFYLQTGQTYNYKVSATSVNNYSISYTFTNLPVWLSFNYSKDILSGSTNNAGKYIINITADDGHGNSERQTFLIYVTKPVITPTSSPIQTTTPVPATLTPTTSISPTLTPSNPVTISPTTSITTVPTNTQTDLGSDNKIEISEQSPKNNQIISNNSAVISAKIRTRFPVNKTNLGIFFDNIDITERITLSSNKDSSGQYISLFSYNAKTLSDGDHNINLTVTNPEGIPIPESWTFKVSTKTNNISSASSSIKDFFTGQKIGILFLILGLLIFIIIIARLIRQGAKMSSSKEEVATEKTVTEGQEEGIQ